MANAVAERTDEIVDGLAGIEGPLLPILHAVQETFGYVPEAALPRIADRLNISRAEVHGVVSFYHDFRKEPAGKHVLKLCRAEACQAQGAEALHAQAKSRLGVDFHHTANDVTLEPVFCLGLCACGPAAMVDGKLLGGLDAAKLDEILTEWGA